MCIERAVYVFLSCKLHFLSSLLNTGLRNLLPLPPTQKRKVSFTQWGPTELVGTTASIAAARGWPKNQSLRVRPYCGMWTELDYYVILAMSGGGIPWLRSRRQRCLSVAVMLGGSSCTILQYRLKILACMFAPPPFSFLRSKFVMLCAYSSKI